MFQWLMSNIQIVIFGVVILSSILGPVFKWLGEKRQQMRIEQERKRREFEELRTGRPVATGPTPQDIERMIAEQVAAQRAEILRQRAEQAEARRQAARKKAEAEAQRQPKSPAQVVGGVVAGTQTYAQASQLNVAPMLPIEAMGAQIHRKRAVRAAQRGPSVAVVGLLGPSELRRAVVLSEILGPPVAMRE